eukprot:UN25460
MIFMYRSYYTVWVHVDNRKAMSAGNSPNSHAFPTFRTITELNRNYWMFCAGAMWMYGTVIPFLLDGSELLQSKYGYSNEMAGYCILVLEGLCIPLGLMFGTCIDTIKRTSRLDIICTASLAMPACFFLFA